MQRFTISLDSELAEEFDQLIRDRGYVNRSEAVRDLLRREIALRRFSREEASYCVATLSYVFDHHERRLSERSASLQHHHGALVIAATQVHLTDADCLESLFLRGPTAEVRSLAERLSAETGIRHSAVNLIPLAGGAHAHPLPHTEAA